MIQKAQTQTGLEVGDRVRLMSNTLAWKAEIKLRTKIGEVIEVRDNGRISIGFDNGRMLLGRDAEAFERVGELGLKAHK
jgi:hypothetical protein